MRYCKIGVCYSREGRTDAIELDTEYSRKIPGDRDLQDINDRIAWEEEGASKFIKSEPDSDQKNNILTYRKASAIPKTLVIVPKGLISRKEQTMMSGPETCWCRERSQQ